LLPPRLIFKLPHYPVGALCAFLAGLLYEHTRAHEHAFSVQADNVARVLTAMRDDEVARQGLN
jgi:hypothetical protein